MTRKEEIETRKEEIKSEIEEAETAEQVEELEQEVDALNEEAEAIDEKEKNEDVAKELEEKSYKAKEIVMEERKNMKEEVRNSKEYIDALADYVKTGDAREVRALLSENVSGGTVAVPDFVYDIVKTAWEKDDIMSLVRKVEVKGNLKVNFEVSATDAVEHVEGAAAVSEEQLVLGIVELSPVSIKKWISISDEVMDLRGEEFLRYVYDELTYKIVKKTADKLIGMIAALPQTLTPNSEGIYDTVSADKVSVAPGMSTVFEGIAHLSDEATDYTIVMNKLTYAKFKQAQLANNYAADIFDNIKVRFNNTLPAYDTASTGDVYAIIGDFDEGTLANYPNGNGIELKYDDKTLMTQDLIRILGRQYVGVAAVANKAFALLTKPEIEA